jgi:hypothetical protein
MILRTSADYYEFIVMDNKGNRLSGVEFRITNNATGRTQTTESDMNGIVHFDGLSVGEYKIRLGNVNGEYEKSDEIINVKIDNDYVPSDTLYMYTIKKKPE